MTFRVGKHSGGGAGVGTGQQAAPAHPAFAVGAVGFGPQFDDDDDGWVQLTEKGRREVADNMAASIVRLECEAEELRAEVALLREQARIITAERDEAREALADIALMDTSGLATPAVSRALRSLGQWKDILDAKTTQDLRQSMESAK